MLAVVWITETNCAQTAEYARDAIPSEAEVTLVRVSPSDVEDLVGEGADGLLGRRPARAPVPSVRAIAAEQAQELLEAARARLARTAEVRALRGHPERELLRACADADLLVLARDRERRLGPKSLSRETRFVVDHAPCPVLLIWPQQPPGPQTVKLPPHLRDRPTARP